MDASDPRVFRQAVGNLLSAAGFDLDYAPAGRVPLDYVFQDSGGARTALKVNTDKMGSRELRQIAAYLKDEGAGLERFICVSMNRPLKFQESLFKRIFNGVPVEAIWISSDELSPRLGLADDVDLSSPETLNLLQTAAVTRHIQKYVDSAAATEETPATQTTSVPEKAGVTEETGAATTGRRISDVLEAANRTILAVPAEFRTLGRQFSFGAIQTMTEANRPIEEVLRLGERIPDVTVVLSDLKNFSVLVRATQPEELQKTMAQYYRRARELVWEHGGTLDKFIGDAVLAIFNYPIGEKKAALGALSFCRDLIHLGERVLDDLSAHLNDVIDTGTRTGVSSGDIWALDIGSDDIEVSFFGDTINLAARLEENCEVNGCLVDNRTLTRLKQAAPDIVKELAPEKKELDKSQVKGQENIIRAWQFSPETLSRLPARSAS